MKPGPKIDVVIPLYNGARTIESSIRSIQSQTLQEISIIVVDDGSTDDGAIIVEKLAKEDARIRLVRQHNCGIVDALNNGIANGSASLIARQDADDLSLPTRFDIQYAYLTTHPQCVGLSGALRHIDETGKPLGSAYSLPPPEHANVWRYPQLEPYLSHPFLMMRREAVERVRGYRYVFHAEDTDLYWRLQEIGDLHNLPDLLGYYRVHSDSITSSSPLNGRISAVNSQRAGLSRMRRQAGHPDLEFRKSALPAYVSARSLEAIIQAGSIDLSSDEASRLAISTAAKMLELAGHRSYELERDDCAFIAKALLPALGSLPRESRDYCARMLSGTAARLASKGKLSEARKIIPARLLPIVAIKLTLRIGVPLSMRRHFREMIRGYGFTK